MCSLLDVFFYLVHACCTLLFVGGYSLVSFSTNLEQLRGVLLEVAYMSQRSTLLGETGTCRFGALTSIPSKADVHSLAACAFLASRLWGLAEKKLFQTARSPLWAMNGLMFLHLFAFSDSK